MNRVERITILLTLASVLALGLATACSPGTEVSPPGKAENLPTYQMPAAEGINAGNLAPDFQLQDVAGNAVSLSKLRGKPVIVNFWASWCPPCRMEMPFIQQVYEKWSDRGLVILAVNIQESATVVNKFMADYSLTFSALLDITGEVAAKYKVRNIPTTFFIDRNGKIQLVRVGAFASADEIERILMKIM